MDARQMVDRYVDGEELLEHFEFEGIHHEGEDLRACCKICGGSNPTQFKYDTETNKWICYTCGAVGDSYQIPMTLQNLSYPQAIMKVAEIFHVDIGNLRLLSFKSELDKDVKEWKKLMSKKLKQNEIKEYVMPDIEKRIPKKFRTYDQSIIEEFKAFFTPKIQLKNKKGEDYSLFNRFAIPVFYNDKLVGLSLRRTNNNDIQKWSHQGFESGQIVYNFDKCLTYLQDNPEVDEVYVCEGIFDVWSFHQQGIYNVVASFGAHLTIEQVNILSSICTTLVLAYDGDIAGRDCITKITKEYKSMFDLYIIPFNEGIDPGNCDDIKSVKRIHSSKWR